MRGNEGMVRLGRPCNAEEGGKWRGCAELEDGGMVIGYFGVVDR